jgi:hypothetical protein
MSKVEWKLSSWHRLYLQLQDARQRLQQLRSTAAGSATRLSLEAEVSRLQQESDSELEAFNSELMAAKGPANAASLNSRQAFRDTISPRT